MRAHHTIVPSSALVAAALALASPAQAGSPQDVAAAEALFNEGKALSTAKDFERACPKFVESQRLDPTVGTLLNVGSCYESLNKLASAWAFFKEAEMMARSVGSTGRQAEAVRRAGLIEPRLAKLTIVVPPGAREIAGLTVRRDGDLVGVGQWGSAIPADGGTHTVEVTAPGYTGWTTVVHVETAGGRTSVEVPVLARVPAEAAGDVPASGFWSGRRMGGLALGGVGVTGLVLGSILGAITGQKVNASKSGGHCDADLKTCDAIGLQLQQAANTTANGANAAFAIGGAALIAGVVVFATAPRGAPRSGARVTVGPVFWAGAGRTGLMVRGGW